ncbi:transport protein Trs120 or TRAPPC9 TRAPP II complex subunit-domain-containing protein [Hyaloraphidium curvatum]|nr:transport protein Trs120 or TRAPPC9 TRAPP II complex subunit-domain-containing protein [Hyaloraphidium curvatum]
MIPNVGNLSVYLSQMIADLCAEVLGRFREVKAAIETRVVIPSPVPYPLPPSTAKASLEGPLRQAPAFNKAASFPPGGAPLPSSGKGSSDSIAVPRDDPQAAALDRWLSYTAMDPRTKKASPSRAQKLVGDLLLLAGRVEDAIRIYNDAIDGMRSNSDFLWQAAATEGLICADVLSLNGAPTISPRAYFLRRPGKPADPTSKTSESKADGEGSSKLMDVLEALPRKYRELISLYERGQSSLSPDALDKPVVMRLLPDGTPIAPNRSPSPSVANAEKPSLLDRVSSRFGGSSSPSVTKDIESTFSPLHSILGVRAALRTARLLAGLYLQGNSINFEGGGDWHPLGAAAFLPTYAERSDDRASPDMLDVASWLNKASSVLMQNALLISVEDRCWASSFIALLYGMVGMQRKWAFHMRIACLTVIDELRKGPRGGIVPMTAFAGASPEYRKLAPGESLVRLLMRIGAALRLFDEVDKPSLARMGSSPTDISSVEFDPFAASRGTQSQNDYLWLLREVKPGGSRYGAVSPFVPRGTRVWRDYRARVHFGWADLQLSILRESVQLANMLDYPTVCYDFLCLLLRRFHLVMSPKECSDAVRQLGTAYGDIQDEDVVSKVDREVPRLLLGVPVMVNLELERLPPSRHVYVHRTESPVQAQSDADDAFIYNPYDEKTAEKGRAEVACGEPIAISMTLANPLDVELPLSKVSIWATGVRFESDVTACLLPAQARQFRLRLTGMPLEPGELSVEGVRTQTVGGIEEDVAPLGDVHVRIEDERERLLGKTNIQRLPALASRQVSSVTQGAEKKGDALGVSVLPEQPILECIGSSLGSQNTLTLFEGESSAFSLTICNGSSIAIDSILASFKDEYDVPPSAKEGPEAPEDIYEREIHEKGSHAFWIAESADKAAHKVQLLREPLAKGGTISFDVACLGRRWCIGTTVILEYGSLPPESQPTDCSYSRVVAVPVLLSVSKALEPVAISALPYADLSGLDQDLTFAEREERRRTHLLLAVDVKNASTESFRAHLFALPVAQASAPPDEPQLIQGGAVKRFHFSIPRCTLAPEVASRPIPFPDTQFVVTRVQQYSPDEAAVRQRLFWHRERLFGGLGSPAAVRAIWSTDPDRGGTVDLRRLSLTPDMLDCLEEAPLSFSVTVGAGRPGDGAPAPKQLDLDAFELPVRRFSTVTVRIANATAEPMPLMFRMELLEAKEGEEPRRDVRDKVLMQGASTSLIPAIPPSSSAEVPIPVFPLKPLRFVLRYHALGPSSKPGEPRRVFQPPQPVTLVCVGVA